MRTYKAVHPNGCIGYCHNAVWCYRVYGIQKEGCLFSQHGRTRATSINSSHIYRFITISVLVVLYSFDHLIVQSFAFICYQFGDWRCPPHHHNGFFEGTLTLSSNFVHLLCNQVNTLILTLFAVVVVVRGEQPIVECKALGFLQ